MTGGLLWGAGNTVCLSLDRADLWDLRVPEVYRRSDWTYSDLERLVSEKDEELIAKKYDEPYGEAYSIKLPGARLELEFAGKAFQAISSLR